MEARLRDLNRTQPVRAGPRVLSLLPRFLVSVSVVKYPDGLPDSSLIGLAASPCERRLPPTRVGQPLAPPAALSRHLRLAWVGWWLGFCGSSKAVWAEPRIDSPEGGPS